MDQSRVELRLQSQLMGQRVIVDGAIAGDVLAALVDLATKRVVRTTLPQRTARQKNLVEASGQNAGTALSNATAVVLERGKKRLGKLTRVWAERGSDLVTHLAASTDAGQRIIAIDQVAAITSEQIMLKPSVTSARDLQLFREDAEIAGDVSVAIETTLLDPRARRSVHARVEGGNVDVSGTLENDDLHENLLESLRRIPGVGRVRSDIVVATDLADEVASAIQKLQDKGTIDPAAAIEVTTEHQIIFLGGRVKTIAERDAAETTALGVTGVRLVVNNIIAEQPDATERADPASPKTHLK
jgi:osmotically-inducible protein OsmY